MPDPYRLATGITIRKQISIPTVLPEEAISRGLLESLGFTHEGRADNKAFRDGEYRESTVYSIFRTAWRGGD